MKWKIRGSSHLTDWGISCGIVTPVEEGAPLIGTFTVQLNKAVGEEKHHMTRTWAASPSGWSKSR